MNSNSNASHDKNNSSSLATKIVLDDTNYLSKRLAIKSHGTITFRRNHSNKANFIRIAPDVSPIHVKELFLERYRQKRPTLVVSVIGNAREYGIKSKLFRIFRQGLLKIAKTTDVWILTGGINSSITKLLGEIIRTNPYPSEPIHLIGIAPWGCVAGASQLDVHGTNVIYSKSKSDGKDPISLEPNHTDFIFIDDGTKHKYGSELEFRARFERVMSGECDSLPKSTKDTGRKDTSKSSSDGILVVLVVIEGDLETIKKVHQSVVENKIPVVFVEDTGGCCDLFLKCYQLYHEYHSPSRLTDQINEDSLSFTDRNEYIKNKLREKFQTIDHQSSSGLSINLFEQEDGRDYFELIYQCVERRQHFLNFFALKTHRQVEAALDLAILQALLKVTSETNLENKSDQLNLAFQWKRIDIVKNFIMKDDKDWKTMNLDNFFEKALIENQIQFIQLFLDHDFPLEDFFEHPDKLLNLYNIENYDLKVDLNNPLRSIYTDIFQPIIGEFFQVDSIFSSDHPVTLSSNDLQSIDCSSSIMDEIDIDKELFLWSVLTGKQELALLFWARGKNKICAALIAMLIYKYKAREDKKLIYNIWANEFQKLAVQILEKFYSIHPSECTKAIIREIPQFGNVTWLHLAVMAEAKYFIAQRAIQDVLNDIWYGRIDHSIGNGLIIVSTWMLWYSGFLPYNQELVEGNDQSRETDDFDERLNNFQCHKSRANYTTDSISDGASSKLVGDIFNQEEDSITPPNTGCWKRVKTGVNQYIENIFMFLHAPCVKYLYNMYSYVLFLILFSYVILCDFFPLYQFESDRCFSSIKEHDKNKIQKRSITNFTMNGNSSSKFGLEHRNLPAISELILTLWVFTLFCEAIRQWISIDIPSVGSKTRAYLAIFWNKLDVLATGLFFVAFSLRFMSFSQCFCAARIVLAIDLSLWYIRALQMFSAVKKLGPKLVMIEEMTYDLKFFMLMLTVFVLAFGVPTYSLINGVQNFSWHIPRAILNLGYWQIFGELQVLDDIEKNYEMSGYVVFILLIVYMVVASVLLINLLIAMFSNTFDRLKMDTDCIWKYQRYFLVCHHLTRPSFPPPLIIISHIYRVLVYAFSHVWKIQWFYSIYIERKARGKFKIVADEILTKKIEIIEDALGNEVYLFSLKTDRKLIDYENDFQEEQLHSSDEIILNKMKILENQVQTIQNQQMNMFEYMEHAMNGIKRIVGDEITIPNDIPLIQNHNDVIADQVDLSINPQP